jgi:hypothetical protein
MEGSGKMIVENHKGISIFTESQLKVERRGIGLVSGSNFVLEGIGSGACIDREYREHRIQEGVT